MTQTQTRTPEQVAIIRAAHETTASLICDALPGTGKTTTLIDVIRVLKEPSAIVLAFNKKIAEEMSRRLPLIPRHRIVHVKTLHSAGFWITRHHFPRLDVSGEVTEQRIRAAAGEKAPLRILGASTKLLRIVKDFQHEKKLDLDLAWQLGFTFGCFDKLGENSDVQRVVETVERAYRASMEVGKVIDFPDQGWLPLVLDLEPPWRYRAVLVDEAQDVNPNQMTMIERLLAPGGRIIAAGDLNQQIYEWRGAVGTDVWDRLKKEHKARTFPLTVSWRCDQAIVDEVKPLIPTFKARPGAGPGVVSAATETQFYADSMQATTVESSEDGIESVFVLSRNNSELFRVALEMWKTKIPFNLAQSQDVINPIKSILTRVLRGGAKVESKVSLTRGLDDQSIEEALSLFHHRRQKGEAQATAARKGAEREPSMKVFEQQLGAWYMTEMMKASAAGSADWADRIEDQYKTILYCANYVRDPREIEPLLETIFLHDETCWITLSTVHKAKGLEADHVYLLRDTFARHQNRVDREGKKRPIAQEEINIEIVAITRAKKMLTWVGLDGDNA